MYANAGVAEGVSEEGTISPSICVNPETATGHADVRIIFFAIIYYTEKKIKRFYTSFDQPRYKGLSSGRGAAHAPPHTISMSDN